MQQCISAEQEYLVRGGWVLLLWSRSLGSSRAVLLEGSKRVVRCVGHWQQSLSDRGHLLGGGWTVEDIMRHFNCVITNWVGVGG